MIPLSRSRRQTPALPLPPPPEWLLSIPGALLLVLLSFLCFLCFCMFCYSPAMVCYSPAIVCYMVATLSHNRGCLCHSRRYPVLRTRHTNSEVMDIYQNAHYARCRKLCRGGATRSESKSNDRRGRSHHNATAISRPPTLKISGQNRFGRIRYRCCQCAMFRHNTSDFHLQMFEPALSALCADVVFPLGKQPGG